MNTKKTETADLEALFQAARQVESRLIRERAENAEAQAELQSQSARHATELERARHHARQLTERDQRLREHLAQAREKLRDYAAYCVRQQQKCDQLSAEIRAHANQNDLSLQAARASFHQMRKRSQELQESVDRLLPELGRTRDELERAQADVLDREHRYQASILDYEGRDRHQLDAMQVLKDQLKQTQEELTRYKSRWLETERQRQQSDQARQEAEKTLRRQAPSIERIKELEEANRSLQQRISVERGQRQAADASRRSESQERESIESELRMLEKRLSYTEAQLAKAAAEAALLRAAREKPLRRASSPPSPAPRAPDLETLEKLAIPGYPVQEA